MEIHEADQSSRQARTMSEIHLVPGLLTGLECPRVPPGMAVWSLPFWWKYVTFLSNTTHGRRPSVGKLAPRMGWVQGVQKTCPVLQTHF